MIIQFGLFILMAESVAIYRTLPLLFAIDVNGEKLPMASREGYWELMGTSAFLHKPVLAYLSVPHSSLSPIPPSSQPITPKLSAQRVKVEWEVK